MTLGGAPGSCACTTDAAVNNRVPTTGRHLFKFMRCPPPAGKRGDTRDQRGFPVGCEAVRRVYAQAAGGIAAEVAEQLEYARSKIRLVINRADAAQGIRIPDVEASVRRSIDGTIVSDGRLSVLAVNRGVPFVVSHPDSVLSRDVTKLARTLAGEVSGAEDQPNKRGLFARR